MLIQFFIIQKIKIKNKKLKDNYDNKNQELNKNISKNIDIKNLKNEIETLVNKNNILQKDLVKYKVIVENILESTIILNSNEEIVYYNKKTEKMFKYLNNELNNKNIKELIAKEDYDIFERYNDSKYSIPYNIKGVKKDKSKISIQILRIRNAYKTIDENNFDLVILRDVTKYMNIKNKEQEENKKLNDILEHINAGVIVIDKNNKVESLNPIAQKAINIKNPFKRKVNKLFTLRDRYTNNPFKIKIPEYTNNKNEFIQNKSLILENKNLEKIKILYSISPIIANNSVQIKGAVIVFQDVTYKEKIEGELAKQEKLKSIGILAGGIAHDFNNFLASILGNIMLAKEVDNINELKTLLQESENAINRATSLTKQLMTFSKGDTSKREIVENLDQLINEYISFALRGSNIKINHKKTQDKIWNCQIDKNQISQVIHNTVINAKQAMPYGGEIFYEIENIEFLKNHFFLEHKMIKGRYIKIIIKDTGIGIKKENLKNIFDPYFTTKATGTGLGLAISYSIIKKHNGKIIIESEEGKGTKIIIFLPATTEKIKFEKPQIINTDIQNKILTILIMDDEEMILKILSKIIEKEGHTVILSKTGEEAYSIYHKYLLLNKKIDLIITDLTIPNGMGGELLAQKILQLDNSAKLIVSSGYYNSPIISNFKDYGFKASLEKPYKIKEVKDAIIKATFS